MEQWNGLMELQNKEIDEIEVTSRLLNMILEMSLEQQLDLLKQLDATGYGGARRHVRTLLKKPWAVFLTLRPIRRLLRILSGTSAGAGCLLKPAGLLPSGKRLR